MKEFRFQAHRGVNTVFPENTLIAYEAAVKQGYKIIELDPRVTADGEFVLHHDGSVNRTGRHSDGSSFTVSTPVSSLTLKELKTLDFGIFKDEKFAGTKIPTLGETLDFIKKNGISIKIDSCFENLGPEALDRFMAEIKDADAEPLIGFTCKSVAMIARAAKEFPYAEIHWDGVSSEEQRQAILGSLKHNRFTVWIPYDNQYTAWFRGEHANESNCAEAKTFAELGIWTLSQKTELEDAVRKFGADAIETNGELKPYMLDEIRV